MAKAREKRAVLIAGPTASGKSALALARARAPSGIPAKSVSGAGVVKNER